MPQSILMTIKDTVAYLTLNREEKRNALTHEMIQTLIQYLKQLAANEQVRLLILEANGDNFCAGADIAMMKVLGNATLDKNYQEAEQLADLLLQLYQFPKPTLAVVKGNTRGGGLGLVAACDIAIAEEDATFAFSEVKIGLTPSTISPYVIAAIGARRAHYYFLTASVFDAYQAHHDGLIHRVSPAHKLLEIRNEVIQQLLANSLSAMQAAKILIRRVAHEKISAELAQLTAEHLSEISTTKDAKEGITAFLEKRKPAWSV